MNKKMLERSVLAAGALAACYAMPASAAVVQVTGLNQNIAANTSFNLDVDNSGTADLIFNNTHEFAGKSSIAKDFYNRAVTVEGAYDGAYIFKESVTPGTLIGPALAMDASVTLESTAAVFTTEDFGMDLIITTGKHVSSQTNIGDNLLFGFKFLDAGGNTDFGWLDVSISDPDPEQPYLFKLNGFAYDDSGAPLPAAAVTDVPEPASLLLLAIGAAGLASFRRKKDQA